MTVAALAMVLIFGAPTLSAMTPMLWALFALNNIGTAKKVLILDVKIVEFLKSPAGRAWLAANGEAAIRFEEQNNCIHHGGC